MTKLTGKVINNTDDLHAIFDLLHTNPWDVEVSYDESAVKADEAEWDWAASDDNPLPPFGLQGEGRMNYEDCPVCGQPDNCGDCNHVPV